MFFLYSLAFTLGVVFTAPFYIWRYRKSSFLRESWRERLGHLPAQFRQEQRGAIWVHAVSVGETLAAAGLVVRLQQRHPERKIFMSHVTPTGREAGERRLPGLAGRFYLPLDWSWCLNRALDCIKPAVLVVVETELWPNLLRVARRSGARIVLVNARLSDKSFPGYRLFYPFMRRIFESVDWVLAQTPEDAERFRAIGAAASRVLAVGNLKFDGQPPEAGVLPGLLKAALVMAGRSPVLVAASTMPGEEELVLSAWNRIHDAHPRSLLILAPRHPPRFERVAQLLSSRGVDFVRRSAFPQDANGIRNLLLLPAVLLLDSLGELAGVFEVADLVFMGGSFVPTGGHNLLEPAQWGKPVIFGPHMENFRDAAAIFLEARAAIRTPNWEGLADETVRLFQNKKGAVAMGAAARQVVQQGRGATERTLDRISELIDSTSL